MPGYPYVRHTYGWTLTTPEKDVESYDAQGRLTSITTRTGYGTTAPSHRPVS